MSPLRRGNLHGCSGFPVLYRETDNGDWTCPACGAIWRIAKIWWRGPGMVDWVSTDQHSAPHNGNGDVQYRYSWTLVKRGGPVNPANVPPARPSRPSNLKLMVVFRVSWVDYTAKAKVGWEVNGRGERHTLDTGIYMKTALAVPGDAVAVFIEPYEQWRRLAVVLSIKVGKRRVAEVSRTIQAGKAVLHYRIPKGG